MNSSELRAKYLKFFKERGHKIIPSASLVPANDPTILFTTAGMHPLVPYLLGEPHPQGKRLVDVQKSFRTDDIDEVGDDTHNTFFEMLGNWSLGDYWKEEAISWSHEFLTSEKWLGFSKDKLAVSVFKGDKDAPRDEESADIWKKQGIAEDRIAYLGKKDNWWGPPGQSGPCGPDTEIFYWTGTEPAPNKFDAEDKRWVEIWNNVFMQYEKTLEGKFEPLKQRNVDTGMGLERVSSIVAGKSTVYETELFLPTIEKIRSLAVKQDTKSERVIADHMRGAIFLIADGVTPSNKDRGYILRRLIRRSVTHGQKMGIEHDFTTEVAQVIVNQYSPIYPELKNPAILEELKKEELKFRQTLGKGLKTFLLVTSNIKTIGGVSIENIKELNGLSLDKIKTINGLTFRKNLEGKDAFYLFETYGFPKEVIKELCQEVKVEFDEKGFDEEFKKHQELSRTASAGMFKGGLESHSDKIVRLHTATHLMNAALRKVLGENVWQKGSNITEERTRFDFTHDKKMADEEKAEVEKLVNDWIQRDLTMKRETMPLDEARKLGAIGVFGEKYPDVVSVYTVFDPKSEEVISREFCGGPHVEHTGIIGKFKIQKEEAVSAGVRRIKAVIE